MTLWHLLIVMCPAMAIGTALAPARILHTGIRGYLLAIAIGLTVGISCSWIMWRMHIFLVPKLVSRHLERDPHIEWYDRAFYASKFLLVALAGVLGALLSSALLRAIF